MTFCQIQGLDWLVALAAAIARDGFAGAGWSRVIPNNHNMLHQQPKSTARPHSPVVNNQRQASCNALHSRQPTRARLLDQHRSDARTSRAAAITPLLHASSALAQAGQ